MAYVLALARYHETTGDPFFYTATGAALGNGEGYFQPATFFERLPTAAFPPAYPAFLGVVTYLGGDAQVWHRIASAVLGGVSVGLIGFLGRRVGGPAVGLTAAALAAIYPMLFVSDGSLTAESLFLPLAVGAAILAHQLITDAAISWRAAALGTVLGLATLTRSDGALLAVLLVGYVLFRLRHALVCRRRWAMMVLIAVPVAVLMIPWQIRNSRSFDAPVLMSTNSGTLIAGANCGQTYEGELKGWWSFGCVLYGLNARAAGLRGEAARSDPTCARCDEAEASRRMVRFGQRHARQHIEELPTVLSVRLARLLGLYDPLDQIRLEADEGRSYRWQLAGWVMYLLLLPLALAGAWISRRRGQTGLLVVLAVHAVFVGLLAYGNQRFRIVAEAPLLILAAVAVVTMFSRRLGPVRQLNLS